MQITRDYFVVRKDFLDITKRFLSFSDLHYSYLQQLFYKKTMSEYFAQIIQNEKQVDGVLIPGDLLFYLSNFPDERYLNALKEDLQNLVYSLSAPAFISYGNHDFPLCQESIKEKEKWDLKYFLEDRSNGIYVLDNEQVKIDNMTITGFSPKRDAYNTTYMPDKALSMAYQEFQECGFDFPSNHLNILLSHENKFFTYPNIACEYGDLYQSLALIVGGHLHDGYLPIILQKMFQTQINDQGIWEMIPPSIDMCRGLFKVSNSFTSEVILPDFDHPTFVYLKEWESASIVNRGVAKYSWFFYGRPSYSLIDIKGDSTSFVNTKGSIRKLNR